VRLGDRAGGALVADEGVRVPEPEAPKLSRAKSRDHVSLEVGPEVGLARVVEVKGILHSCKRARRYAERAREREKMKESQNRHTGAVTMQLTLGPQCYAERCVDGNFKEQDTPRTRILDQ